MPMLTDEEFLTIIGAARKRYLEEHQQSSLITLVAVELINQYIVDVQTTGRREPTTFLTRFQLKNRLGSPNTWSKVSWNSVAADVGRAFIHFVYEATDFGREWQVSFKGPTSRYGVAGKSGRLAVSAVVKESDSSLANVSDATRIAAAADLVGVCLCCGTPYAWDLDLRLCTNRSCDAVAFRPEPSDAGLYVSILPERRGANYSKDLSSGDRDRLFRLVDCALDSPSQRERSADSAGNVSLTDLLPYDKDHLAIAGLVLGTPLVYRAPRLALHARFRDIFVLDLSTYAWSNTLKDPKSWATINAGISAGISQFALYTAGNAGLSLAKLVYSLNGIDRRNLRVFALIDSKTDADLQTQLSTWGATLVPLKAEGGQRLIDPKGVWSMIAADAGIVLPERKDRWHVTDGWDGVGIVMYRILFRELIRALRPDFVVLPIGTGSLFVGAHLGLRDAFDLNYKPQLVGVVPAGKNILTPFNNANGEAMPDTAPVAPKLVGDYTPLLPCVSHIVKKHGARIVTVSRNMQIQVLRYLDDVAGHTIAAEPSAVLAFAALRGDDAHEGVHEIARSIENPNLPAFRDHSSESRVVIVNTGMGVLGHDEAAFVARNRPTLLR